MTSDVNRRLRLEDLRDLAASERADDDGMMGSGSLVPPQDAEAPFAFLAESSRRLADSLDYETTLATDARHALPEERVEATRRDALELEEHSRTALEDAYRTVVAASRAKSEFLGAMSHDLRTPLNAIGGYAELLEMGLRGPVNAAQLKDLGRIRQAQQRLVGLVDEVLSFVRIETGRVEYEIQDVSVHAALLSLETMIASQVSASNLTYTYVRCDPAILVRADRAKLDQVLLNLLTNALKFTPAGGTVTLSCDVDAEHVVISVRDTGVGIAADRLETIFAPFVQVDRRVNRQNDGIGLGLAISRDLAVGMGGQLTAVSTPGVGSAFVLTLPRGG